MASRIELDTVRLRRNIEELPDKLDRRIAIIVNLNAAKGLARMRVEAPWSDRTGAARTGLFTEASSDGSGTHEILFSHSVPYGIWLEIANSGRYEIILPSIRAQGAELMSDLEGSLGRL